MAGPKKFLRFIGGDPTEVTGVVASTGAPNDGDVAVLDSTGRWDLSLMPTGIVPDIENIVASETIASGALVNVFDSGGGVIKVQNADASVANPGKPITGFVLVGGLVGASLSVYFIGRNTGASGLTPGSKYFLSASTPGGYTTVAPVGTGQLIQRAGTAISATDINIQPGSLGWRN